MSTGAHRRYMSRKLGANSPELKSHYRTHGCNPSVIRETEVVYLTATEAAKVLTQVMVEKGEITHEEAKAFWNANTTTIENTKTASSASLSMLQSSIKPLQLKKELGKDFGKVKSTIHNGTTYIVFKGNQKLRKILTGSRYGITHPKMVSFGFGKQGIKSASRGGFIVSFVVCTAFNVMDFIYKDNYTWKDFVGAMVVDLTIAAVATAIGVVAGIGAAAMFGVAAITVGPIIVAVVFGVGAGLALSAIDQHFGIRKKIASALDTAVKGWNKGTWNGDLIYFEPTGRSHQGQTPFLDRIIKAFGAGTPPIGQNRKF